MLPSLVHSLLNNAYGKEDYEKILTGFQLERPVTFRANTLLATYAQVSKALDAEGVLYSTVPWFDKALILNMGREELLWNTDIYRQGKIYLQSLSSMLPPLVLSPLTGADILDMCAAPGGKTSLISSLFHDCPLTACEIKKPRYEKLVHNLKKLGVNNANVMKMDARKLDDFFSFDAILVDAPCTGSGTFDLNKDDPFRYFSKKLMDNCISSQKQLLQKACKLVKVGGEIIYSTCSLFKEENEEVLQSVLSSKYNKSRFELQPIPLLESYDFPLLPSTLENVYTLYPDELFEGFFIAKIKRIG